MKAYIYRLIAVGAVAFAVFWAGLFYVDVMVPVVTADGIITEASPNATFGIVHGKLALVKGSGGVTNYNAGAISGMFVPFLLLSLFAMYGALSVGKPVGVSVRHTDRPGD